MNFELVWMCRSVCLQEWMSCVFFFFLSSRKPLLTVPVRRCNS